MPSLFASTRCDLLILQTFPRVNRAFHSALRLAVSLVDGFNLPWRFEAANDCNAGGKPAACEYDFLAGGKPGANCPSEALRDNSGSNSESGEFKRNWQSDSSLDTDSRVLSSLWNIRILFFGMPGKDLDGYEPFQIPGVPFHSELKYFPVPFVLNSKRPALNLCILGPQ